MRRKAILLVIAIAGLACGGDDTASVGGGGTGQSGSVGPGSGGSGGTSSAGGAGGASTAGSTMGGSGSAGTATGSGGSGTSPEGGAMCTVGSPNNCDKCVFAKCCAAYAACSMNDDCLTGIGQLAECVAGDPAGSAQCYDTFATDFPVGAPLRMCVKMNCDAMCTTETP